ncbi:MAG: CBS domain-containing protein [Caldilineaceae bacterium]
MHRIPVTQIMQSAVITVRPEELAADAAEVMEENHIRRLPVVDDDGCLVGIVTDANILEAETAGSVLSSYEPDVQTKWLTVADIMTRDVVTIDNDATVGQLAMQLMEHKVGGVPVVTEDETHCNRQRITGIVTETDIFRMIAEAWQAEQAQS